MIHPIKHLPDVIRVGVQTENGVEEIGFDVTPWLTRWPGMALSVWATLPGQSDAYMAHARMEGSVLYWDVTDIDTQLPGRGKVEIMGRTEDGTVKKLTGDGVITIIHKTTTATTQDPPLSPPTWVDTVAEMIRDASLGGGGGTGTVTSVNGVEPDKDGNVELEIPDVTGKLDADKLPEAIDEALAQAKASGEFDGEPGANGVTFTPYIDENGWLEWSNDGGRDNPDPIKVRGEDGQDGEDGTDGVGIASIKQTTTSSADGGSNVVTVTLTNGTTATFTIKNGSKGSKGDAGVSPTVSVSKSGKVTTVKITDANGTKTATINDGADGKTPVKGTDYFTAADKTEMVSAVIAALPVYGGEYE